MPFMKPRFRVVVSLDVRYHAARRIIAGILRFAASHGEWDLQMRGNHPFNDGFTLDPDWRPDGMIVDGSWTKSQSASFRDMVAGRRTRQPLQGVVFANCIPPQSCRIPHAMVRTDERAISVAAAELFMHHGFTHFAFVGPRIDSRWSVARRKFFAAALRDAGHEAPFVYKSPKQASCSWAKEIAAMAKWLKSLPKPCGIWAAYDQRAKHVLDICRNSDVDVPKQVQVLGVDDESYICEQTNPPLSSVSPDFEAGGYMAAEALHSLMSGIRTFPHTIKMPLLGVTERLSTIDLSCAGSRVNRAREYIRRRAESSVTVAEVVQAVGGSARLLEKNFKTVLGHSICREIQNQRMECVKRRLKDSSAPINSIAAHFGFKSGAYLMNMFRRHTGMTMSEYRRTC